MCGERLDKPYALPCREHYVGPCCKDRIQAAFGAGDRPVCTVNECGNPIPPNYKWTPENRYDKDFL